MEPLLPFSPPRSAVSVGDILIVPAIRDATPACAPLQVQDTHDRANDNLLPVIQLSSQSLTTQSIPKVVPALPRPGVPFGCKTGQ